MSLAGIPSGVFGGDTPNGTAQAWVLGIGLYTIACFLGAAAILAVLYTGRRRAALFSRV